MKIVLPFRGEFGIMVRYHVPAVAAIERPVLVCHEPGLEALYPSCDRLIVDRKKDAERRWTYDHDKDFVRMWKKRLSQSYPTARFITPDDRDPRRKEHRFVPEPWEPQRGDALAPDVVICPRKREYGPAKNWPGWRPLAGALKAEGLRVFSAGAKETSYRKLGVDERAWDYERTLDATIEAMRAARLVIATDAGLAHLAVLCGAPLLLVGANGGRVAPGQPTDGDGKPQAPEYWPIRIEEYYRAANHTGAMIEVAGHGWSQPAAVVARCLELVRGAKVPA